MAVTMTERGSDVDNFLRAHRSKLSEEKARMRVRETSGPVIGILPNDDGRDTALKQRRREMQNEYLKHTSGKENQFRPRPNSIAEIRQKMQQEREHEVKLTSQEKSDGSTFQRGREQLGIANAHNWDEEHNGFQSYTKEKGHYHRPPSSPDRRRSNLIGLGRIGHRDEESPEDKKKRQSQYRSELMEQMRHKGKGTIMGHAQLFDEEGEHPRTVKERRGKHLHVSDDRREPHLRQDRRVREIGSGGNDRRDDAFDGGRRGRHREDEETDDVMFHNYPPVQEPSLFRGYPYHPPQYPNYAPYCYPHPYPPPMYPPPMPHPPYRSAYYEPDVSYPDKNPYLSDRYHQSNYRRSPPHSVSPEAYTIKSRRSPTLPNKEVKWKERERGGSPQREDKGAGLRAILDQQIREKKEREEKEKKTWEKVYRKIEDEADVYDPWGKPGGGAPLTDALGNAVTERGQLRKSFDDKSPRVSEEERKRLLQEKNRRDLEEQMEENQQRQMREKVEKQQQEEEEEARLKGELQRLNLKGKREIEEERKRKEEEKLTKGSSRKVSSQLLSKQELAEQRFREEMEKKKIREDAEKERLERLAEKMAADSKPSWKQRSTSPPIPTLRNKPSPDRPAYSSSPPIPTLRNKPSPDRPTHSSSPPIPAIRSKIDTIEFNPQTTPTHNVHVEQADLHQIRPSTYQKSNESTMNDHVTDHMTVASRPPSTEVQIIPHHSLHQRKPSLEVLQGLSNLKNHIRKNMDSSAVEPIPLPSRPSIPSVRSNSTMQQFNKLKYSKPSKGRANFWKEFPDPPRSNTALEIQQEALLRHQKKEGRRQWDASQTNQNHVRSGPIRPRPPTGQSMFTVDTLDIDSLAMRNEERARRLEAILATNDRGTPQTNPQYVLEEFLHRQQDSEVKRRGQPLQEVESETSLDCDTTFFSITHHQ